MSSVYQTLEFGSGIVFATPSGGNQPTNPTPVEVGVLQNVKVTLGAEIKALYGQLQYPVDTAIGKRSIKGTFEFALMELLTVQNMFTSDNIITGVKALSYREQQTIGPAVDPPAWAATHAYSLGALVFDGTYVQKATTAGTSGGTAPTWNATLGGTTTDGSVVWTNEGVPLPTITVNNAGEFIQDLGVRYATSGFPMEAVPSNPTIGEYAVNVSTGVYTFAVADESQPLLISYRYTQAGGNTLQFYNHTMGFGPIIGFYLQEQYQNNSNGLWLPNARCGKIDLATKLDDYAMSNSDFEAFALPSGLVGEMYGAL
jgi:hypothetical protein